MNALNFIRPYKRGNIWVFDEEIFNLKAEPFIQNANKFIDLVAKDIRRAEKGFNLVFSRFEFPSWKYKFDWRRAESGGNWYYSEELKIEGWLCSVLGYYFDSVPETIYAAGEELPLEFQEQIFKNEAA